MPIVLQKTSSSYPALVVNRSHASRMARTYKSLVVFLILGFVIYLAVGPVTESSVYLQKDDILETRLRSDQGVDPNASLDEWIIAETDIAYEQMFHVSFSKAFGVLD